MHTSQDMTLNLIDSNTRQIVKPDTVGVISCKLSGRAVSLSRVYDNCDNPLNHIIKLNTRLRKLRKLGKNIKDRFVEIAPNQSQQK